jgi:flagellin
MIINTNLASLNTVRQLGINEKNTQGSLAKLSSGLRINSAADDAAGLAISEKMRGQISGLNKASSNAQDGISLVGTAEGSLNETTSILQRMRELAVQAGNDTSTTSDRTAMQTEMNQLTSEVNRIGNTTEFNTQKLLNGGQQITTGAVASDTSLKGGSAVANTLATPANTAGTDDVAATWTTGAIVPGVGVATNDTFTFGGTTVTLKVGAFTTGNVQNVTNGAADVQIATADIGDATKVRDSLLAAFTQISKTSGSATANITFAASGINALTATDTKADGATNNGWAFAKTGVATMTAGTTAGVTGTFGKTDITFTGAAQEGSFITVADKKIAFYNSASGSFANATVAKAALGADYVVDVNGVAGAPAMATAVKTQVGVNGIAGFTLSDNGAGVFTATANAHGTNATIGVTTMGSKTDIAAAALATGSFTFTSAPTDGSSITISGKKIGFYDSSLGKYNNAAAAATGIGTDLAVDVKGLTAQQVVAQVNGLQTSFNSLLTSKVTFGESLNANGSVNLLVTADATTAAGFKGNTISLDESKNSTAGFSATLQIGANTAQTMVVSIGDMRSQALAISGTTAGGTITASNGSVATLTVAKTASNGSDNNNTEYTLDISSATKATAAISVIDDATAKVSAERSNLGAVQNRLEHTINNLGTSSQNITTAEANIRDVDMAKEMTNFQKNNILQQAAQSMLAQANQQGQGVLKLLQ